MARSGYPRKPMVLPGAFVQLAEDLGIIIPNVVLFQFNPEKVTRGFEPWNPFPASPKDSPAKTPTVQPFTPEESYSFDLEYDATEDIADGNPVAQLTGVATQIAAIRKLLEPTDGLFGDLIGAAKALVGEAGKQAERPVVPILLFVLGPGTVLPVRITKLSVTVNEFLPTLYPLMATVSVELRVLPPEVFDGVTTAATKVAVAAFNFTRLQEDALAIASAAAGLAGAASLLPI
jgi:hypothetical protein